MILKSGLGFEKNKLTDDTGWWMPQSRRLLGIIVWRRDALAVIT